MANFIFQETQRIRQLWIWGILIVVAAITLSSIIFLKLTGSTVGWDSLIPVAILISVFTLFSTLELKTRIDQNSLSFSYFPFIKERKFSFEAIVSLELIEYNGFWEYGGWGIKWNGDSWSYTSGGKHGFLVKTAEKKFLLGTQNPEDAQKVIDLFQEYKSKSHGS